jgi:hypothetical protein
VSILVETQPRPQDQQSERITSTLANPRRTRRL